MDTCYSWIYGIKTTNPKDLIDALEQFQEEVDGLPKRFHYNFYRKLISGGTLIWINQNKSSVVLLPTWKQSTNGLVEITRQTSIEMARSYLTKRQMSWDYWFWSICHAVKITNHATGHLGKKLTSPYELLHGYKTNPMIWFEILSTSYFHHQTNGTVKCSTSQALTMASTTVGCNPRSNNITLYNPNTHP